MQELLALLGIAVGVGLLFASQVASTSLTGSVERTVRGTVGHAQLQMTTRSSEGLRQQMLERVRRLPGVRRAAPILEARATIVGPKGRKPVVLLGFDRDLTLIAGPVLRQFRTAQLPVSNALGVPTPIARAVGIPLGGRGRVEIAGRTLSTRVAARLTTEDIGGLAESPIAVAALPYAQELAALPRRITRVLVQPEPGRRAEAERGLRQLAGNRFNVLAATSELALFRQAALPVDQSTTSFAAISALVGFLFAFNAMLLTLSERRRLIDDLRVDGYRPRRVTQVVLFDALVLGAAASVAGLALGDQLSRHLFQGTPGYLSFAFPVGVERIVEWQNVAIAVGGGIAATILAALLPLLDILRHRPGITPAPAATRASKPMLAAAAVSLAASVPMLLVVPQAAIIGVALVVLALMLVLPSALYGAFDLAWRASQSKYNRSAVPMISVGELRAMHGRSVALAATGAIAVFGMVAIQGSRGDLQKGLDSAVQDLDAIADIWISPSGLPNTLATTAFQSPVSLSQFERLPGIQRARIYRSGFLDVDSRRLWIVAPPREADEPIPPSQMVDGNLQLATDRLRAGGWAVVSKAVAAEQNLEIGDSFTLPAPKPTRLRVAGLSTNIGWAPGTIVINADDYGRAWETVKPSAYHLTLEPGASPTQARRKVAGLLNAGQALTVETTAQRVARQRQVARDGLTRLNQLTTLMLIGAILAMAAATAGMVWQRRARLAALKLDGFGHFTLWRALVLESIVLLGAGCFVGSLFGLYGQQLLDRVLTNVTGFPVVYTFGAGIAAGSFAVVTVVAVVIAAVPGYFVARVPPSAGFQE